MRLRSLDVGVERITQWNIGDEQHLPPEASPAPAFLPQMRPLDEIMRRPSLDERLPDLLQPDKLDPGLLDPSALTDAREGSRRFFAARAGTEPGDAFAAAAVLLGADAALDDEVRAALALLLRG